MKKTGILILAAGSSSRLGQPKQLLSYRHKTLLGNTIEAAIKAVNRRVLVILGSNHQVIANNIDQFDVSTVYNPDWEDGISSSIRTGLAEMLLANEDLDAVILSVCDQPFITQSVFEDLIIEAAASNKSIIASAYGEVLGTPVLFDRQHFDALSLLRGNSGAKTLLIKYKDQVAPVSFDKGEIDIDTPEDYSRLNNN